MNLSSDMNDFVKTYHPRDVTKLNNRELLRAFSEATSDYWEQTNLPVDSPEYSPNAKNAADQRISDTELEILKRMTEPTTKAKRK